MANDKLDIDILDDGRIRSSSPGSVSAANHSSAEAFFRFIATMTDGSNQRQKIAQSTVQHKQAVSVKEGQ